MSFTDDDLKRLKVSVEQMAAMKEPEMLMFVDTELKPLIARMEAAENALETMIAIHNDTDLPALHLVSLWRKAAGKDRINDSV